MIVEDVHSVLKINAVLAPVAPCLGLVPFELDHLTL